MKKKWIWIALGAVLVAIFAFSALKRQQGKVTQVELASVVREDVISHVKAPGKIEPFTLVKMSATVPGKVERLAVKEGQKVRRGQLLLELDPTQYEAEVQRANAALAGANSRMRQAKFNQDRALQTLERNRALAKKSLVSADVMEQVETAANVARSEYQASLDAVKEAQASKQAAQDNLDKTRFSAPFDGVVSQLNVEQGENVITGTMNNPGTQILAVADTSRMIVRAEVDETDVVDVAVGQASKIKVDAYPDSTFRGEVIEVGNTAKNANSLTSTGQDQSNFEVKVVFLDHIPTIKPGMTADVDIETRAHRNVLAVPIQSVVVRTQGELDDAQKKGAAAKVRSGDAGAEEHLTEAQRKARAREISGLFVVRKGVASFVPVRPGISGDLNSEVVGAVSPGDQVVSGPYKELRSLKDGARVKRAVQKKGEKKE